MVFYVFALFKDETPGSVQGETFQHQATERNKQSGKVIHTVDSKVFVKALDLQDASHFDPLLNRFV